LLKKKTVKGKQEEGEIVQFSFTALKYMIFPIKGFNLAIQESSTVAFLRELKWCFWEGDCGQHALKLVSVEQREREGYRGTPISPREVGPRPQVC